MLYDFIYLTLLIIVVVLVISLSISSFSIAPWVPSRRRDRQRINKLADLKSGQIFYELGCGDARVSAYIARHNPSAKIIGIELALPVYLYAKIRQVLFGPKNMNIIWANALHQDLSKADLIYTFALIKTINNDLKNKFVTELKPGAKILSYVFSIKDWPGKSETNKFSANDLPIHIYQMK